jgi:NAD(P)-dependent dehydrogenase (short-subunit alcohol dehydrogenase family)
MEKPLTAKVALVTRGSRGIGAATELVLAARGFRAVVNHRASAPQAEEVPQKPKGTALHSAQFGLRLGKFPLQAFERMSDGLLHWSLPWR